MRFSRNTSGSSSFSSTACAITHSASSFSSRIAVSSAGRRLSSRCSASAFFFMATSRAVTIESFFSDSFFDACPPHAANSTTIMMIYTIFFISVSIQVSDPTPAPPLQGRGAATATLSAGTPLPCRRAAIATLSAGTPLPCRRAAIATLSAGTPLPCRGGAGVGSVYLFPYQLSNFEKFAAKVRINERNAKEKTIFLFISERKYLRAALKGTTNRANNKIFNL